MYFCLKFLINAESFAVTIKQKSMKKHSLLYLLLTVPTILDAQSVVETHTFFSSALGVEKTYLIYLPDGYSANTTAQYPVVYFLRLHENEWFNPQRRTDGKTLKHVADELIENGMMGKMILVAPSTGGNNSNPSLTDFGIVNMLRPDLADDDGIGTGAFEDYLFQDLIPHIDSTFRTIPEWCARGVDGFSLGGFAATLYALRHPGVFSSVGSYEGTIMWYNFDYPATEGPLDDYNWYWPGAVNSIAPMFDLPFDTAYMRAHSATNILVEAAPVTLDSIRQISFHISAGAFNATSNLEVNEQFVDSLAAKGINNTFDNLILAPNATHNFDWADEHAKKSLVKHWETFTSFSCNMSTSTSDTYKIPQIKLLQNYPNPVSSFTTIAFETSEQCAINIDVFDSLGRKISTLLNGVFPLGRHQIQVDMSELPDGVYHYQLESNAQIQAKKLLVLRNKL